MYEHIGQLYQGLKQYYLVIGIPLPTEKDISSAYTDVTINCDYTTHSIHDQTPIRDLMQMCVNFSPAITKKSAVLKKIHYDPIVLPTRGYIYGFQPNLLTEFDAPGPYRIQFMASYLDLCTPIPPATMQGAIPYRTEDTRL